MGCFHGNDRNPGTFFVFVPYDKILTYQVCLSHTGKHLPFIVSAQTLLCSARAARI